MAERARRSVTNDVPIYRVIENRIRAAVGLKRAIAATWQRLDNRRLGNSDELVAAEYRPVIVSMHIPQAESRVTHLSQHARLIRGVNVAVLVVNRDRNAGASGRL